MNRAVLSGGVVVVAPLLAFLALGLGQDPKAMPSPLLGNTAPGFALADLDGEITRLVELRGQPVVLNFWATWCGPCVVEHPVLQTAARRYGEQVRFLGVIYHDQPSAIRDFLKRRAAWGPSLIDAGSEVAIRYGVYGAPETFFIDAEGIVAAKVTGALGPRELFGQVEALLAR